MTTTVNPEPVVDDTTELDVELGGSYGFERAWRCVKLAPSRQDARRRIAKRYVHDLEAIFFTYVMYRAKYRWITTACTWIFGLPLAALVAAWVWFVSPWLFWVPLLAVQALTAPLRWRVKAMFRLKCYMSQKVTKTWSFFGSGHTPDYRDHKGIAGDGMSNAAQRQVVERQRVTKPPKIKHVKRTKTGWTGTLETPDGMTVAYFNEWVNSTVCPKWVYRMHVEPSVNDAAEGVFTIVRTDPLRGAPTEHPATRQRTDAWAGWVLGVDENGVEVAPELAYEALLSTGLPNSGKSVLTTNGLLHPALDPSVPLFVHDPAGDMRPFALCVEASGGSVRPGEGDVSKGIYRSGPEATDALEVMAAVEDEIDRRHDGLKSTGLDAFARKIKRGQMPPAVWMQEEWQTTRARCKSKNQRDLFDRLHMRIMLQHRKVAVVPLAVTQDPNHLEVPVPVRNEYGIRAAHRAPDDMTSDVALGHGKAEQGWTAASISADQPGVCLLSVGGATPIKMRSYYVSDEELVAACEFAAQLRREYHGTPPPTEPAGDADDACGVVGGGSGVPGDDMGVVFGSQGSGGGTGSGAVAGSGESGGGGSEGSGGSVNGGGFVVGSDGSAVADGADGGGGGSAEGESGSGSEGVRRRPGGRVSDVDGG